MKKRIFNSFLSLLLCISLSAGMSFDAYAWDDEEFSGEQLTEPAEAEDDAEDGTGDEKSVSGDEAADPNSADAYEEEETYPGERKEDAESDTSVSGYFELPGKESVSLVDEGISYDMIEAEMVDGSGYEILYSAWAGDTTEIKKAFPYPYTASGNITEYFSSRYPKNRNQNPYGSCWAHSAMALFEFYMINHDMCNASVDTDLSELHTVYYTYNQGSPSLAGDTGDTVMFNGTGGILNAGGNLDFAAQTFMCYRGVVSENDMPYSEAVKVNGNTYTPDDIEFSAVARLKNAKEINIKNTDLIKQCIMENGAVGVSIYATDSCYNQEYNCYYCASQTKTNHAVCLVGWDDDFPLENFKKSAGKVPENNGAWLVRNSWNYGDKELLSYNDYFWISYEDSGLADPVPGSSGKVTEKSAWTFDVADPSELPSNNYFYTSQIHSKSYIKAAYCANVYTACSGAPHEIIKAVSFDVLGLDEHGTEYEVCVYTDVDPLKGPASGKKNEASVTKGVLYLDGKYTIELKNPVAVRNGESFAVVLKRSDNNTACYERAYSRDNGIVYTVGCGNGQSFYSADGGSWTDVVGSSDKNTRSNFVLHAFTDDDDTPFTVGSGSAFSSSPDLIDNDIFLVKGQKFKPAYGSDWVSSDPMTVKIGKDSTIAAQKPGKCILRNGSGKTINIFVVKPSAVKKSIEVLSGESLDLKENMKLALDNEDLADEYKLFFYSSNPSVLSIDGNMALARSVGKTIVYCVINSKIYKYTVKVTGCSKVKSVSDNGSFSIAPMQNIKLKLKGYSFKNVSYSSDNGMSMLASKKGYADNVVYIGTDGVLTGIGCGTSKIECSNGISFTVTVREPVEQIYYLNTSGRKKISVSGIKNSDLKMDIESGKDFISLDDKGRIKALAAGEAQIALSCKPYSIEGAGFDFKIKVCVEEPDLELKEGLNRDKARKYTLNLKEGEIVGLSFIRDHSYAVYQPVVYKNSKPATAFADEKGKVYAVSPGNCVISTKINGKLYKINVKVSAVDQGGE